MTTRVDGDTEPGNFYWSSYLDRVPIVDGHYALRYMFDFTADGCTTRREANHSMIIEAGVNPDKTQIDIVPQPPSNDGWRRTDLLITPMDRFGNLVGPGRSKGLTCTPAELCRIDSNSTRDGADGTYGFSVAAAPGIASVQIGSFGGKFVVPLKCDDCSSIESLKLSESQAKEHGEFVGTITLSSPAPKNDLGGALVFLGSTDSRLVEIAETVLVPAGSTEAKFDATVLHLLDKQPKQVRISAAYGDQNIEARVLIVPGPHAEAITFTPDRSPSDYPSKHDHAPQ